MTAKEIFPLLCEGEGSQGFLAVLFTYKQNNKLLKHHTHKKPRKQKYLSEDTMITPGFPKRKANNPFLLRVLYG